MDSREGNGAFTLVKEAADEDTKMKQATELDYWANVKLFLDRMRSAGVLCSVGDAEGNCNLLTLGWGQTGPIYDENPVLTIAVTPLRYSWQLLEEIPEFVIGVPTDEMNQAVAFCGSNSGREVDKFSETGLTAVPSQQVQPPSIRECSFNIECRIYTEVRPPHFLLTPEHRKRPVDQQHTIYFAEVLGTYSYA